AGVVARLRRLYEREVPVIPGAREAVARVAAVWPLALASSANREIIDLVLELTRLDEYFAATVSSEEVPRGKPASDVYLEAEHRALVADAVEAGVNFIDTAHVYTGGESERTIGAALAPFPQDLIVATKGGMSDGSPRALSAEIDASLRRLQTEAIDLYYLHRV